MQPATRRTPGSLGTWPQRNPQQPAAYYEQRQDIPDTEEADLVKREKPPQAVTIYDELLEEDPCREEARENPRFNQKRQVFEWNFAHISSVARWR